MAEHPKLNLERPIVFFDLETTGTDTTKDRIVEISLLKVFPDGSDITYHTLVNPEMPIPSGASSVHGITDEDVAGAPTFVQIAERVAQFLEGCDMGGYNCLRFDIPLLAEEFHRVGVMVDLRTNRKVVDVQVIYHKREQRTLSAAYRFYCDRELVDAHSAEADTRATYEVLRGQIAKYEDLPNDIDELDKYSNYTPFVDYAGRMVYDEAGVPIINFGKHKGKPVVEVLESDLSYYDWIMKSDFPYDTKLQLTKIKVEAEQAKAQRAERGRFHFYGDSER